jgi:XTP/dITP diphosphohydrolase
MVKLLIATRNQHKVQEIRSLLKGICECVSLREVGDAPEVIEDASTFEGNAMKKAETLAQWLCGTRNAERGTGSDVDFVLADDSGLEVDALGGAPGVQSARYAALETGAAGNASDEENNAKLLRQLEKVPSEDRAARFRCVIAIVPVVPGSACPAPHSFAGSCEGRIGLAPRGERGFGYDPLFLPRGFDQSFAELGEETKNQLSHRSKALAGLREWLTSLPG